MIGSSDEQGQVNWLKRYTPYGKKRYNDTKNSDNESYTGHIDDTQLGLTYMQARFYDPNLGRFLSNDPVGFFGHLNAGNLQGFNRYAYANNDPINMVDLDGKQAEKALGAWLSAKLSGKSNEEAAKTVAVFQKSQMATYKAGIDITPLGTALDFTELATSIFKGDGGGAVSKATGMAAAEAASVIVGETIKGKFGPLPSAIAGKVVTEITNVVTGAPNKGIDSVAGSVVGGSQPVVKEPDAGCYEEIEVIDGQSTEFEG